MTMKIQHFRFAPAWQALSIGKIDSKMDNFGFFIVHFCKLQ